jgi:F5/8 type C domain
MTASDNHPQAAPATAGRGSRLLEWLWRGKALQSAREGQSAGRDMTVFATRARIAAEVGGYALDPAGPWASGKAYYLAAGLFAESIGWSLRLASALADETALADADAVRPTSHDHLTSLLDKHVALLTDAARGRETLERTRKHLLERDFETTTQHVEDVEQAARELRGVAERLLQSAAAPQGTADRVMFQRVSRLGGLVLLLGVLFGGVGLLRGVLEVRADLSRGKPWAQSSMYEQVCVSPLHHCGSDKGYFFHTQDEQSPWLEIDLQQNQQFSALHVFNRQDCCAERVVPLVIEVSTDHVHWREVMRKTDVFDEWKPRFRAVSARWVRLRVAGRSLLHLYDVRVLR